jgi:hypothetical protein
LTKPKTASELILLLGTPNERLAWRSLNDDELIAPCDVVMKDAGDGKYRLVTQAMPEGLMIGVRAGTARAEWGVSEVLRVKAEEPD